MSRVRANSSPDLLPLRQLDHRDDASLHGVGASIKLLLKLIQDYNNASKEDACRKPQRLAEMMKILDDVKSRIQAAPLPATARRKAELRRCNTDLKHGLPTTDQKKPPAVPVPDENQKLPTELSVNISARKGLEKMFSCLGKEKELIAAELAKKVRELADMEELVNDLKAQNEMLMEKVKLYAFQYQSKKVNEIGTGSDDHHSPANAAVLQERNKALSEQLLKSLEGYRSMKRSLKDVQEENMKLISKVAEVEDTVAGGVETVDDLQKKIHGDGCEGVVVIEDGLKKMKDLLVGIQEKLEGDLGEFINGGW